MAERELAFDGDKVRVAALRNRRTLAGAKPASVRQRCADTEADKWCHAAADHGIRESRRVAPKLGGFGSPNTRRSRNGDVSITATRASQ